MTSPTAAAIDTAQAVYSRRVLALYDGLVLGLSNRLIWKCPTHRLLALYNAEVRSDHLEVGVGTGYFLDRCRFPVERPRLVLMDLNPNCLAVASRRVRRYHPQTARRNILAPIPFAGEGFDSIGINYVLHCLPGGMPAKARVFDHLMPLLNPAGVVFGATLLARGVEVSFLGRWLMRVYNARGIFSNAEDSLKDLTEALRERFSEVKVQVAGCAALFVARN
jgi:ubiquinone/menaquinone biosynthesis C-methylase UbiE